jgi:protease I
MRSSPILREDVPHSLRAFNTDLLWWEELGRKALILAGPEFEDVELLCPYYRLQEAGFTVDVVSHPTYGNRLTGKHGYSVEVNARPEDVDVRNYEALILPGGKGPERIRIFEDIIRIVIEFMEKGKTVAAICHGPQLLISASLRNPHVLKGRKLTSTLSIRDDLIAAGAEWVDSEVVVDRNLITSRYPQDIPYWLRELMRMLESRK